MRKVLKKNENVGAPLALRTRFYLRPSYPRRDAYNLRTKLCTAFVGLLATPIRMKDLASNAAVSRQDLEHYNLRCALP